MKQKNRKQWKQMLTTFLTMVGILTVSTVDEGSLLDTTVTVKENKSGLVTDFYDHFKIYRNFESRDGVMFAVAYNNFGINKIN